MLRRQYSPACIHDGVFGAVRHQHFVVLASLGLDAMVPLPRLASPRLAAIPSEGATAPPACLPACLQMMDVSLVNDGPVTIILDSRDRLGDGGSSSASMGGSLASLDLQEGSADPPR